jgi:hypothetical protein
MEFINHHHNQSQTAQESTSLAVVTPNEFVAQRQVMWTAEEVVCSS